MLIDIGKLKYKDRSKALSSDIAYSLESPGPRWIQLVDWYGIVSAEIQEHSPNLLQMLAAAPEKIKAINILTLACVFALLTFTKFVNFRNELRS